MAPAAGTTRSCHFLTVGTGCGNSSGRGWSSLYRGSFAAGSGRHRRNRRLPLIAAEPKFHETNCGSHGYLRLRSTREIPMSNPNEKQGQQNQNPGQQPSQQRAQQQQDPNRQGQKPDQQGKGGR